MDFVSLPAHFDGKKIVLDEPFAFEPNVKLLVTLVPPDFALQKEREEWSRFVAVAMNRAYSDDEPEYEWPGSAADYANKGGTITP